MNYNKLLDFAVDLGYELSMCGAEIYRVEESISRVLAAYDVQAEVNAIPNCITVSITLPDGTPLTRMRRVGFHGNDLEGVQDFVSLARRICSLKPSDEVAYEMLKTTKKNIKQYSDHVILVGYFLGSAAFGMFFGGSLLDMVVAGFSGLATGIVMKILDIFQANNFFKTIIASFFLAMVPYCANILGLCPNADAATTGAVMTLIPGLLFTYAMRDIIFGDTNAGINRIVQVLLIALGIAVGTSGAWALVSAIWHTPESAATIDHHFVVECLVGMMGCVGFSILFNIHRMGIVLGCVGSVFGWSAYCIVEALGGDGALAMLVSSAVAAIFAEVMARIRKCPAIGYLVVSIIPLIPGSALYFTMNYAVRSDMSAFADKGMNTIVLSGMMAVGILLVSTTVRMWLVWKINHPKNKLSA